jgi:hypothetical protein
MLVGDVIHHVLAYNGAVADAVGQQMEVVID